MKRFLSFLFLALPACVLAQNLPAPQVGLSGGIGCNGFPCSSTGTFAIPTDANYTIPVSSSAGGYNSTGSSVRIVSSVTLTGTRNVIYPVGRFPIDVENATTGGQSIQIIGPSGTGVTIPNGSTYRVWNDGTNYVLISSPSTYTLPIATTSVLGGIKPDGTTITVNPSTGEATATGGSSSPFPSSFTLAAEGASLDQSLDIQQEVIISASSPGSGYTSGSTCTTSISGLTGTAQPTVGAYVDASGHVQWSLTYFGEGLTGTGTATVTGGCGAGSGASATLTVPMTTCTTTTGTANCYTNPWPKQLTTLSAMNGRVSAFTNYAISGSNVTDAISRATSNNYAAFCAASANQYFIVGGDLLFNSMSSYGSHPNLTAQVAYAQWISLIHYLKNNGCKVIVTTPNVGSTYAGGTGSSMNGTFVNRVQTAAQLIRNGKPGTDYDYLIDITSALQTNTDPTFVSFDNTHWTLAGDTMIAQFANGALLAGGGPNLAPYYNLPATFDANGAVDWNLASCTAFCFNITAGDGEPGSIESTQTNQLSGWFFMNGSGVDEGHVGYGNGTYGGLGGNLIEVGPDSAGSAAGSALVGPSSGSSYVEVTNQIVLHSSVVEIPEQAAGSGHVCAQFDTSGIITGTGTACGSGSSGLSGMTAGQVPIAATATTVTSSEPLAGAGAGITTGPTSGTTANDAVTMNGTNGQVKDAGFAPAPAVTCTTVSSLAPANNGCYKLSTSASAATPAANSFSIFKITTASGATATLTGTTIADGGNCSAYISGTTFALTGVETAVINSDGTNVWATCTAASSGSGTVTSIATTSPITGGTITSTGTIACATCVTASSPGAGVAHFAGSTQAATSSLIVAADITSGTITGTQIASSIALGGSPTTTTQSPGDNSTKIATTAYAQAAAYPVADTTITIGASVAFSSGTCSSATGSSGTPSTVSMTGLLTTMTATFTPNSDISDVTGWGPATTGQLYFQAWPSASGTLSYYVCNDTGATITTGASTTWNVSAR